MSQHDIIRAWKEPEYRRSLNASQLAALPENPAGNVELLEADLRNTEEIFHTTAVTCTCTGTRQCTVGCAW